MGISNWEFRIGNFSNWDGLKKCSFCDKGFINLRENQSLINPFLGKCNNYRCPREIYLRKGMIFEFNNKTPAQVLHTIIKLWLNDEMNVTKIANKLADIFLPDKVDKRFIYSFITKCRLAIANYMRIIYQLDCIAPTDSHFHIAVDHPHRLFTTLANRSIKYRNKRFKN